MSVSVSLIVSLSVSIRVSLTVSLSVCMCRSGAGGQERSSLVLSDAKGPARIEAVFAVSKTATFEARGIVNGVLCSQGTHIEFLVSRYTYLHTHARARAHTHIPPTLSTVAVDLRAGALRNAWHPAPVVGGLHLPGMLMA